MNDAATNVEGHTLGQGPHAPVQRELVKVTVRYLPSPAPFHREYDDETQIGTVRADSMEFFHVKDYKDRNEHKFLLEFEGRVLTNMTETLEQLLGVRRHEANFNLIEQVIQG
jgi:hypothetical protein